MSPVASKCAISVNLEESTSSHKGKSSKVATQTFRCSKGNESFNDSHFGVNGVRCDSGVSENICQKNGPSGPFFDACDDHNCVSVYDVFSYSSSYFIISSIKY